MNSKAIFNLAYVNGEYPKDGHMKSSYHTVGTAFLRDQKVNGANKSIEVFSLKLDSYPPLNKNVYAFEKVEDNGTPVLNTTTRKTFTVMVPNGTYPSKDGDKDIKKTSYHKVGIAYLGDKGLNFKLFSLPFPNKEGKVWLNLFEITKGSSESSGLPKVDPSQVFEEANV